MASIEQAMNELPSKEELEARAAEGDIITQAEASRLASQEAKLTEGLIIKGGTAATAQSIHDRQLTFLEKAGEVSRKKPEDITEEDAAELMSAEARALGRRPSKGSTAATAQSIADRNANRED